MSGSQRGMNLYKLLSSGEAAPNEIVNDLMAEIMVKSSEQSEVRFRLSLDLFFLKSFLNQNFCDDVIS